jgi:GDPmannose 4,6-dehydratase
MKTALVTGVTGQDGSYLSELLLSKGYRVIGLHRRSSTNTHERINHISNPNFLLEEFDITDPTGCHNIVKTYQPDELYNLAAQSHVGTSFKQPSATFEIDTIGVVNLLEAVRLHSPATKFYQASTSEMFGRNYSQDQNGKYQNEQTELLPQSPYGVAKTASYRMVQIYRSAYELFACSGILFNHESPRRGENFLTRKVTKYIGQLVNKKIPKETKLGLGNLDAYRDWGHAKDYVNAMYLMLQNATPNDYVISTGETHSVREFCKIAFETVNLNYTDYVYIDPQFYRPAEVDYLRGDSSLAKKELNWSISIGFKELVQDMVYSDIEKYNDKKL